jgi:hypothetical protein
MPFTTPSLRKVEYTSKMVTVAHIPMNTGSMFLKLINPVTRETCTDKILEEKYFKKDLFFLKYFSSSFLKESTILKFK